LSFAAYHVFRFSMAFEPEAKEGQRKWQRFFPKSSIKR
jgi:hypothetical protein